MQVEYENSYVFRNWILRRVDEEMACPKKASFFCFNVHPVSGWWHYVDVDYGADDSEIFPLSIFSVQRWQYSVHLHGIIIKKQDSQALNRHESPSLCNLPRILYLVGILFSGKDLRVSDLTS
jgi:hypothetical protein